MAPHPEAGHERPGADVLAQPSRLRLFWAVDPGAPVRAALDGWLRPLRETPGMDALRFVRPEGLHVTLCFLGDVDSDRVPALREAVAQRVRGQAPFALSLASLEAFPSARRPRALALRLEPEAPLAALAEAVTEGVRAAGLPSEERAYRPHLTLARVRRGRRAPAVTAPDTAPGDAFPVTDAVLYRSQLDPKGARYTALARVELGTEPASSRSALGAADASPPNEPTESKGDD